MKTALEELPLACSTLIKGIVSWDMRESSTAGSFYNIKFDIFISLSIKVKTTGNPDYFTGGTKLPKII
jgi:hypothetical protein